MNNFVKNAFLVTLLLFVSTVGATEKTVWGNQALYALAAEAPDQVDSLIISDGYSGTSDDTHLFSRFTDVDIEFLATTFPNLKKLEIRLVKELTDDALAYLAQLPHLTSLSISGFEKLTSDGLSKLVTVAPQLQELHLSTQAPYEASQGICTILKLSSIETLTLANLKLSKAEWKEIFAEAPQLQHLILEDDYITREALFSLKGKAPQLQSLHIKKIDRSSPPAHPSSWQAFFKSFPKLNEIVLDDF